MVFVVVSVARPLKLFPAVSIMSSSVVSVSVSTVSSADFNLYHVPACTFVVNVLVLSHSITTDLPAASKTFMRITGATCVPGSFRIPS